MNYRKELTQNSLQYVLILLIIDLVFNIADSVYRYKSEKGLKAFRPRILERDRHVLVPDLDTIETKRKDIYKDGRKLFLFDMIAIFIYVLTFPHSYFPNWIKWILPIIHIPVVPIYMIFGFWFIHEEYFQKKYKEFFPDSGIIELELMASQYFMETRIKYLSSVCSLLLMVSIYLSSVYYYITFLSTFSFGTFVLFVLSIGFTAYITYYSYKHSINEYREVNNRLNVPNPGQNPGGVEDFDDDDD